MTTSTAARSWSRGIAGGLMVALISAALLAGQARPAHASKEGRRNSIIIGVIAATALLAYSAHKNQHDDKWDRDGYRYDAYRGRGPRPAGPQTGYRHDQYYPPPAYQQQWQQRQQQQQQSPYGQTYQQQSSQPYQQQTTYQHVGPQFWQHEDPGAQWATIYR